MYMVFPSILVSVTSTTYRFFLLALDLFILVAFNMPPPSEADKSHLAGRLAHVRSAIVTGTSSGIGRSIATSLAAAGVGLVVCADLDPATGKGEGATWETDEAEKTMPTHRLIARRHGKGKAVFVRCDVTTERGAPGAKGEVASEGEGEGEVGETVWGVEELVKETVRRAGGRLDVYVEPGSFRAP